MGGQTGTRPAAGFPGKDTIILTLLESRRLLRLGAQDDGKSRAEKDGDATLMFGHDRPLSASRSRSRHGRSRTCTVLYSDYMQ